MRISVDAHALGRHLTGNEVYVRNLLIKFAEIAPEADFVAYASTFGSNPHMRVVPEGSPRYPYRPIRSRALAGT